jgi:peptidoglycan/xylan/chitin deacetylase (PgdA/CDA1 family)
MRFLLVFIVSSLLMCGPAAADGAQVSAAKRIALSFDDAPKGDGPRFTGDERTSVLLKALESSRTGPVVFFVTTSHLERPGGSERVARYADAGHLIANHSHSHSWLKRTDTNEYIGDIDQAEKLLAPFENRRAWFRFPYLDEGRPREQRDSVRTALATRGLKNGYVTVDNYDWYLDAKWKEAVDEGRAVDIDALRGVYVDMLMGAVAFFDNLAIESLDQSPAHVILLHENDVAAMFIGDLVSALRANGWSIVSPDEAYADPISEIIPATLMTNQGHVAALAVDEGLDPRTLTHLAIEETQIDALLAERGVFGKKEDQ